MPKATHEPTPPRRNARGMTPDVAAGGGAVLAAGEQKPSSIRRRRGLGGMKASLVDLHSVDAGLLVSCQDVLMEFDRLLGGRTGGEAVDSLHEIERLAIAASKINARTAEGLRAKAEVIRELLTPGAACYAAGQLAISLADDLLGRA